MSDIDGVRKIEYVLMDSIGRRTSMCCTQWEDDEFVDVMPRMSDQSGQNATKRDC